MSGDRRGFCYALEPVRSQNEWELNDVARALAVLNGSAAEQEQKVNHLSQCFAAARAGVIAQRQAQCLLDIDAQRLAHAYMVQVQQHLVVENAHLRTLRVERDECAARIRELRKFADSLDRNKETAATEYDRAMTNKSYLQADDSWMQRLHWRKKSDKN